MILSDHQILAARARGQIKIEPFDEKRLGTNSYDVSLGKMLSFYVNEVLDAARPNEVETIEMSKEGFEMKPWKLYLGVTEEYTETHGYVPWLDGKSSVGRLGIYVHITAGRGDVGFMNHWTLEMVAVQPVIIYPGMPIGQLTYFETGNVMVSYDQKKSAKYNGQRKEVPLPMPSMMWRNFGGGNFK